MAVKRSDFLIIIYYIHVRQYKHVLDEYDHGNKQNPPFSKLHIEQFEGSRTFTNFIEPLLPKSRTEQPCFQPHPYSPQSYGLSFIKFE
jgi:hypothetical protein